VSSINLRPNKLTIYKRPKSPLWQCRYKLDNGEGVVTDYLRAYMWWSVGAYNGDKLSAEYQESIANKMTPAHISKAQDMSSRCLESNYTDC